ncbi:MAG: hypothetical protein ABIZ81_15890 [Opitutaceae bacterium]
MRSPLPLFLRPSLLIIAGAVGFVCWINVLRIQRVEYLNAISEWSVPTAVADPKSPTGYANAVRRLIVPGHHNRSYEWIIQTQQAPGTGTREHHVDYDNAPFGRESHSPALYRWWLTLIAQVDRVITGASFASAAERAALYSDGLLHVLLIASVGIFLARWFGIFPAALVVVAAATLFPLASGFVAGAPDHQNLGQLCLIWSLLPLLAAMRSADPATSPPAGVAQARRLFLFAAIAGGAGLWISVALLVPMIAGLGLGIVSGMFLLSREKNPLNTAPWRLWGLAGCATTLLAYAVEYFPSHLSLQLQAIHPVYGLAWLGLGELLHQLGGWRAAPLARFPISRLPAVVASLAAIALLPIAMLWSGNRGFLAPDPLAARLGNASSIIANSFSDWIHQDGFHGPVVSTCLPLVLIAVAFVLLSRRATSPARRRVIVLVLGPVTVAFTASIVQLRWFNALDVTLLALLVAAASPDAASPASSRSPGKIRFSRWGWTLAVALMAFASVTQWMPPVRASARQALADTDVESIVERDLSHWLSIRSGGGAVVLASPDVTTSAIYHGGLRGLGTFNWENREGLAAAVRIASATSPAEALALIQQRGITHVVIPSWDSVLEDYTRIGSSLSERSFIAALKHWAPLVWLKPLPYQLPKISGFEAHSVAVFEVVEEQEESTTLSWQAEYFAETGQRELATAWRKKLQRFPGNLGVLVALAQVDAAIGDNAAFSHTVKDLVSYSAGGADRALTWERRAGLATVLALGGQPDLSRTHVQRCLAEIDETRARTLTTATLFRLLTLGKRFGIDIADPRTREAVRRLLPPEAANRL